MMLLLVGIIVTMTTQKLLHSLEDPGKKAFHPICLARHKAYIPDADIMTKSVLTVPPEITVEQLVSDYFLVYHHGGYPVVKDGQVLGLVTLQCVRNVPKEKRVYETVQQAMIPCKRAVVVKPSVNALDAMQNMARNKVGRVLVVDGRRLVGIATREDIVRTIQTRQDLELGPADLRSVCRPLRLKLGIVFSAGLCFPLVQNSVRNAGPYKSSRVLINEWYCESIQVGKKNGS